MEWQVRLHSALHDRLSCCVHRLIRRQYFNFGLLSTLVHHGQVGLLVITWLGMDGQVRLHSVLHDRLSCCVHRLNRRHCLNCALLSTLVHHGQVGVLII